MGVDGNPWTRQRTRPMTGRYDPITTPDDIVRQIAALEGRLTALNKERSEIAERLAALEQARADHSAPRQTKSTASITMESPIAAKIALFGSLFRGRRDVFPRRWETTN